MEAFATKGGAQLPTYDVEVRGLTKVFDNSVVAVRGVSFGVEKGSFFTLLGPSGSGKSTILRMIGGLERPSKGRVFIRIAAPVANAIASMF